MADRIIIETEGIPLNKVQDGLVFTVNKDTSEIHGVITQNMYNEFSFFVTSFSSPWNILPEASIQKLIRTVDYNIPDLRWFVSR